MRIVLLLSFLFAGIYFEYQSCVLTIALLILFFIISGRNGKILWKDNYAVSFFWIMAACYLFSAFWAVDSHLALNGFLKFLPLPVFAGVLLQMKEEEREALLALLPAAGTVMTLISVAGSLIPAARQYFLVNNRLAGTFQYPNAFALFLMIALLYLLFMQEMNLKSLIQALVMLMGIMLSGSRTVYLMFPVFILISVFLLKNREKRIIAASTLVIIVAVALIVLAAGMDLPVGRLSSISLSDSTLLGRILYWKDALPVILKHPFGLGYMGYYFTQGGFQTGVYSVNHVHNEFLQIFLDVGWLPGLGFIGLFVFAFLKSDSSLKKLLLAAMGLHFIMDFDLQFIAVYMVFMLLLPWECGKEWKFGHRKVFMALSGGIGAVCLYFGAGSAAYYTGFRNIADFFVPSNTFLQIQQLEQAEDMETLEVQADEILQHNSFVALAWSAKARAAFSSGDITKMLEYKQKAISLSRYSPEEYEDEIYMLYTAAQLYEQSGDRESARYCMEEAVKIPDQMKEVLRSTDELAWRIRDKPELELSDEYRVYIEEMRIRIMKQPE